MENVTVVGRSTDFAVVELFDAPGSVLRGCHVRQEGSNAAVRLVRSSDATIDGGVLSSPRYPLVTTFGRNETACLLKIGSNPELIGGDPGPEVVRFSELVPGETPTDGAGAGDEPVCVASASQFDRGNGSETVVAITDFDGRRVQGAVMDRPEVPTEPSTWTPPPDTGRLTGSADRSTGR